MALATIVPLWYYSLGKGTFQTHKDLQSFMSQEWTTSEVVFYSTHHTLWCTAVPQWQFFLNRMELKPTNICTVYCTLFSCTSTIKKSILCLLESNLLNSKYRIYFLYIPYIATIATLIKCMYYDQSKQSAAWQIVPITFCIYVQPVMLLLNWPRIRWLI